MRAPSHGPREEEPDEDERAERDAERVVAHVAGLQLSALVGTDADERGHAVHRTVDDALVEARGLLERLTAGAARERADGLVVVPPVREHLELELLCRDLLLEVDAAGEE